MGIYITNIQGNIKSSFRYDKRRDVAHDFRRPYNQKSSYAASSANKELQTNT
jgi:hypothetical protein